MSFSPDGKTFVGGRQVSLTTQEGEIMKVTLPWQSLKRQLTIHLQKPAKHDNIKDSNIQRRFEADASIEPYWLTII